MWLLLLLFLIKVVSSEWVDEMENPNMFEGDIVLDPDERESTFGQVNTYASIKGSRWPGAKVPYEIQGSIGSGGRRVIQQAFEQYHKHTCLRFYPRTNEASYISFHAGSGCSSPIGYRYGRRNSISLKGGLIGGCQKLGTTMHEIGHSIGLYHEQSRPDRDSYIRILWNSIKSGKSFNFNKHGTNTIDSLGTPYDFRSMMHYSTTAFGSWGRRTIETIDPENQKYIGQRRGFSKTDIVQINKMYCDKVTPTKDPPVTGGLLPTPPDGCLNTDNKCSFWASNGYCAVSNVVEDNYREIMKNKCCKACTESAACRNRNDRCDEWANRGECSNNTQYMHENCRKSCKRCS